MVAGSGPHLCAVHMRTKTLCCHVHTIFIGKDLVLGQMSTDSKHMEHVYVSYECTIHGGDHDCNDSATQCVLTTDLLQQLVSLNSQTRVCQLDCLKSY